MMISVAGRNHIRGCLCKVHPQWAREAYNIYQGYCILYEGSSFCLGFPCHARHLLCSMLTKQTGLRHRGGQLLNHNDANQNLDPYFLLPDIPSEMAHSLFHRHQRHSHHVQSSRHPNRRLAVHPLSDMWHGDSSCINPQPPWIGFS
jgi:hypothetical protein